MVISSLGRPHRRKLLFFPCHLVCCALLVSLYRLSPLRSEARNEKKNLFSSSKEGAPLPRVEVVKIGKSGLTHGDVRRDVYLVRDEQLQIIDKSRTMIFAPFRRGKNPLNQRAFAFDGETCMEDSVEYEDLFLKYKKKKNLRRLWTKRYTPEGAIYTFKPPATSEKNNDAVPSPEDPEVRFCVTLTISMMMIGGADEVRGEGLRYFNNTLSLVVFWSPW
ncbi:hypothetical protein BESB_055070 [Besnoitia besnoiti]|uniref:Uncharacterized protein n=1 Tax=Besnoitia besnoiti TaxID=94643 RepID=A0A2A9MIR7_BESBE|nr:hypothetical protein BESB_055070 [Besnoitia besnoiti]PFH35856.1 hypothetical protein BESB_055070 [Besnoitia besnoiti]